MRQLFYSTMLISAVIAISGCGSSSDATPSVNPGGAKAIDGSAVSTGSAAIGIAADVAFNQLYLGNANFAWQPRNTSKTNTSDAVDAGMFEHLVSAGGPGTPTVQNFILNVGTITSLASGNITYVSKDSDTSGLPSSWWHVLVRFGGQYSSSFTMTNDDGGTATITGGEMNMYVYDSTGPVTTPGNWTRTADVYAVISTAADKIVTMRVTPNGGATRTVTVSGIRHVKHQITRTNDGTTIQRVDVSTVDGDVSALPISVSVNAGPNLADAATPAVNHLFTQWIHTSTLPGSTTPTIWTWNRWAAFTMTQARPVGQDEWSTSIISAMNQAIYLTKETSDDTTVDGPMTQAQFRATYQVSMDLTKAGQHL